MANVKYNVKGVEAGQDFDTPIPVNVYKARIVECVEGQSKSSGNDMLTVTLEIATGDWKGRKLWDYIVLNDASAWKLRQFLEAVGIVGNGKKEQGTFDPQAIVGTLLQVRVRHQTDEEFGTRAKVGSLSAMPEGVDEDVLDDEEEPEDEDEAEEEDIGIEDLEAMDRDELEELVEENDLEIRVTKRTSDEKLRERITEALGLEAEEEGEDEEAEAEDYSGWSVPDLKTELKARDLSPAGTKATLIKKLEKDDASDGDAGEPF